MGVSPEKFPDLLATGGDAPSATPELKKLVMALFDVMDRDYSGTLQREEIVVFLQKTASSYGQGVLKYIVQVVFEVFSESGKQAFKKMFELLPAMGVSPEGITRSSRTSSRRGAMPRRRRQSSRSWSGRSSTSWTATPAARSSGRISSSSSRRSRPSPGRGS